MADVIDRLGERLAGLLTRAPEQVPSMAPGGGPEAAREGDRAHHEGERIGSRRVHGRDALGYGGHGDAVAVVAQPSADVQAMIGHYLSAAQRRGLHQPRPAQRIRLAKPFSPEAHIESDWNEASGPYSLFNGTIAAPSAGNSLVPVPITLPVNIPSPVMLLDRYPSALYMCVYVRSFAFVPTGTLMTGLQECYFQDVGGSVVGLGIYNPAAVSSAIYQKINALCTTPVTDPGNTQIGTLFVNNIGIAGTPASVRYQLGVGFVAFYPDPVFNERMAVPPLPADVYDYLRTMGAQGD